MNAYLTPQEHRVVALLAGGLTQKEVAQRLGLSYNTVRNHISEALERTDSRSTVEVVVKSLRHGWLSLDEIPPSLTP